MKAFSQTLYASTLCAAALLGAGCAGTDLPPAHAVPAQKIGSGLRELPPDGQVIGQKLDSGLGELPHYRDWADKSGRAPLGEQRVATTDTARKQ
jgi:hypothetical protein